METWVWLAVYLLGFALLQLVLYRYFRQSESTHERGEETPEPGHRRLERAATGREGPREPDGDDRTEGVRCRHCGTPNDPDGVFTYCRECVQPLR